MTLFTEGHLQAYERMMQQTCKDYGSRRNRASADNKADKKRGETPKKAAEKGGERRGCNQS